MSPARFLPVMAEMSAIDGRTLALLGFEGGENGLERGEICDEVVDLWRGQIRGDSVSVTAATSGVESIA